MGLHTMRTRRSVPATARGAAVKPEQKIVYSGIGAFFTLILVAYAVGILLYRLAEAIT